MSSFCDNFTSNDRWIYDGMTQCRLRHARDAENDIKAEGNRDHLPTRFYCFERHRAACRGNLYELIELKRISFSRAIIKSENASDPFQAGLKLCREIPLLRLKMIPECSQLRKQKNVENGVIINPLFDGHSSKMPRKTVHFLPRSQSQTPPRYKANSLTLNSEQNQEKRLVKI